MTEVDHQWLQSSELKKLGPKTVLQNQDVFPIQRRQKFPFTKKELKGL